MSGEVYMAVCWWLLSGWRRRADRFGRRWRRWPWQEGPTGIAVEVSEPRGIGRCRMQILADGSAASLHPFVTSCIEPGAKVITDAWMGYHGLAGLGYAHERRSQRAAHARGEDPGKLLPAVHRVASLVKRWLLSTHQGSVDEAHLQSYLDEFVFRFNRRRSRSRGLVFYRVLELAAGHDPVRYRDIVTGKRPRKIRRSRQRSAGIRRAWSGRQRNARGGPLTCATPVKWRPLSTVCEPGDYVESAAD